MFAMPRGAARRPLPAESTVTAGSSARRDCRLFVLDAIRALPAAERWIQAQLRTARKPRMIDK
jgi:hypothetical protein